MLLLDLYLAQGANQLVVKPVGTIRRLDLQTAPLRPVSVPYFQRLAPTVTAIALTRCEGCCTKSQCNRHSHRLLLP